MTMLPLYQGAELARNLKADAHRGLWWSRFFNKFGADFSKPDVGGKGEFISEICKGRCGDADVLSANTLRQTNLLAALGGVHSCYQTQGRFVTGMGNDHPTENGFTWHPTLGVPYLPASSVKGLVRGWLEWQWCEAALKKNGDAQKRQQLLQWFGSEHKEPKHQVAEHQAGWFIFFDALPIAPVQLASDVMTPHYGKWYENGGDEKKNLAADTVPADWHSPVPVTFLTVKKATFQFGIAVRAGLSAEDKATAQVALPQVLAVLQDALEWAGAGAKTATGYGRMVESPEGAKRREREQQERIAKEQAANVAREAEAQATAEAARLMAMNPVDRKLEAELFKPKYKGQPPWQAWLAALKEPNLFEVEEQHELAHRIRAALENDGKWSPEEKSKQGERCRNVLTLLDESAP
jgi:CRISPR-associated protein Cmr6